MFVCHEKAISISCFFTIGFIKVYHLHFLKKKLQNKVLDFIVSPILLNHERLGRLGKAELVISVDREVGWLGLQEINRQKLTRLK